MGIVIPTDELIFLYIFQRGGVPTTNHGTAVARDTRIRPFLSAHSLAGLVSITAGCANMECGSAVLTGLLGGFVYQAGWRARFEPVWGDPLI